ncbi:MAG: matrixin family metalloprotease [Chloroflexi bacterium]|nr:matrixin family metalloprotease [Chloroflexota bacterium]
MNRRIWSLGLAGVIALALVLASTGSAAAYSLADYGATTIPLWGFAWGKTVVTVKVDASKGVSGAAIAQTRQAIADWNAAINTVYPGVFTFQDVTDVPGKGVKADVVVRVKSGGGMVQGQALCNSSGGLAIDCKVNVSGKAFGSTNSDAAVLSIALQELGHTLGLLHADNNKDVMYGTLQDPPSTQISACDMKAWETAMQWLFDGSASPHGPTAKAVSCP